MVTASAQRKIYASSHYHLLTMPSHCHLIMDMVVIQSKPCLIGTQLLVQTEVVSGSVVLQLRGPNPIITYFVKSPLFTSS